PGSVLSHRPAENLLAHTQRIHVRSVKEVDSRLEGLPEKRAALLLLKNPFPPLLRPVRHRTEADPRYFQAGRSEVDIVHKWRVTHAKDRPIRLGIVRGKYRLQDRVRSQARHFVLCPYGGK